ncbi:hypothetical protein PR048_002770, partial [Dryococelus australis]
MNDNQFCSSLHSHLQPSCSSMKQRMRLLCCTTAQSTYSGEIPSYTAKSNRTRQQNGVTGQRHVGPPFASRRMSGDLLVSLAVQPIGNVSRRAVPSESETRPVARTSRSQSENGYATSKEPPCHFVSAIEGEKVGEDSSGRSLQIILISLPPSGFLHVAIVPDDAAGRRVFSGISRFLQPLNSGAAPYSPHFTLFGSQNLDFWRVRHARMYGCRGCHGDLGAANNCTLAFLLRQRHLRTKEPRYPNTVSSRSVDTWLRRDSNPGLRIPNVKPWTTLSSRLDSPYGTAYTARWEEGVFRCLGVGQNSRGPCGHNCLIATIPTRIVHLYGHETCFENIYYHRATSKLMKNCTRRRDSSQKLYTLLEASRTKAAEIIFHILRQCILLWISLNLNVTLTTRPCRCCNGPRWLSGVACSPPTKVIRTRSPAESLRIFACGNRSGRLYRSAGFLGDLPFPRPFHSHINHPQRLSRPR